MSIIAIQDRYPATYSHCYGCGAANEQGWRIKTFFDGETALTRHTIPEQYTGGWPTHAWGGMVAALIDCHSAAAASGAKAAELGLGDDREVPRCVTAHLEVDFVAPTPAGVELTLVAHIASIDGRKIRIDTQVQADSVVTARGHALMIQVRDPGD